MGIIRWVRQRMLARSIRRESERLAEIRAGLRKLSGRSTQLRPMVQVEQSRARELARQLRRVRTVEDLKRWRGRLEMCLPALQAMTRSVPTGPGRAGSRRRGCRSSARR